MVWTKFFLQVKQIADASCWWGLKRGPSLMCPLKTLLPATSLCMNKHETLVALGPGSVLLDLCCGFSWVVFRTPTLTFPAHREIMAGAPGIRGPFLVVLLQLVLICSSQVRLFMFLFVCLLCLCL